MRLLPSNNQSVQPREAAISLSLDSNVSGGYLPERILLLGGVVDSQSPAAAAQLHVGRKHEHSHH